MSWSDVCEPALIAAQYGALPVNDLPPGVFMGGKDIAEARAGTYAIDPDHSAVLPASRTSATPPSSSASIVFRQAPGIRRLKSTLSVSVPTASISSPVKGFPSS
jgi:hypothetical protein